MVHDPKRDQMNRYSRERQMKCKLMRFGQLSFFTRAGWLFRFPDLSEVIIVINLVRGKKDDSNRASETKEIEENLNVTSKREQKQTIVIVSLCLGL